MNDTTIIKTQTPESVNPCKIVTRPSGDNPWYLVCVTEVPEGLEGDVVEDTSAFLTQFDLSAGEEDEEFI